MSINLDTTLHLNVYVNLLGTNHPLKDVVKDFKQNKEFISNLSGTSMNQFCANIISASLYANDMEINIAEHVDIALYLIGQKLYTGRLRDFIAQLGTSVEQLAETRKAHLECYRKGVPIFRKEPIVIDLTRYNRLTFSGKITESDCALASNIINENLVKLIVDWNEQQELAEHPEYNMIADDEWYPDKSSVPEVHQCMSEPDFSEIPENDNYGFVHLKNKDDDAKVVEVLPNKQKLVRLVKHDGNVHYIVVGEDIDVARLPKIYSMFLRDELAMGCNITTDRLTRILKLHELIEVGFTASEAAEYLDVPKHIVYSDIRILRNIELLNNK